MEEHAVEVKEVIGPFGPEDGGMIMLSANGKMFPVECGFVDGQVMSAKPSDHPLPYSFMHDTMTAAGVKTDSVKICSADNSLYCQLYFSMPETQKNCKLAVTRPSLGIQLAMAGGIPITIDDHILSRLVDATPAYWALKSYFKTLWPLPPMTSTASLRAVSEFVDEVMPNGRIFSR